MTLPNNDLDNQDDYLKNDQDDSMQDTSNSDAAKFNADEQAKVVNDREYVEYKDAENLDTGASTLPDQSNSPLTTQGNFEEKEENMGGTTNLTLDQLKKEHDPEGDDPK